MFSKLDFVCGAKLVKYGASAVIGESLRMLFFQKSPSANLHTSPRMIRMLRYGVTLITEYWSGWRCSKCRDLSSNVGIPNYKYIVVQAPGRDLFVGVLCRRPQNLFAFGSQKVYMFEDIPCMASRGTDHSSTPTTDWRLNGKLSIFSVLLRGRLA